MSSCDVSRMEEQTKMNCFPMDKEKRYKCLDFVAISMDTNKRVKNATLTLDSLPVESSLDFDKWERVVCFYNSLHIF